VSCLVISDLHKLRHGVEKLVDVTLANTDADPILSRVGML